MAKCASPSRPTPDVAVTRKPIRLLRTGLHEKTASADLHHARIVPIAMEEMTAKRKERWVGKAVILKDNCLFHLLKNPLQPARHPLLTAKIFTGKVLQDSAWPIDPSHDARASSQRCFSFSSRGPSAITNKVVGANARICSNTACVSAGRLKIKKATGHVIDREAPTNGTRARARKGLFSSGKSIVFNRAAIPARSNLQRNMGICPEVVFFIKPQRKYCFVIQQDRKLFCKSPVFATWTCVGERLFPPSNAIVFDGISIAAGYDFFGDMGIGAQVVFFIKPSGNNVLS